MFNTNRSFLHPFGGYNKTYSNQFLCLIYTMVLSLFAPVNICHQVFCASDVSVLYWPKTSPRMGIAGLLPIITPKLARRHISTYKTQRIGIDGQCWSSSSCYLQSLYCRAGYGLVNRRCSEGVEVSQQE